MCQIQLNLVSNLDSMDDNIIVLTKGNFVEINQFPQLESAVGLVLW